VACSLDGKVWGGWGGGPAVPLSSGGGATGLTMEMGVNGAAYAVWTQNGDVRAAQLRATVWTPVPLPLESGTAGAPTTAPITLPIIRQRLANDHCHGEAAMVALSINLIGEKRPKRS
jgi:hypothetical protein